MAIIKTALSIIAGKKIYNSISLNNKAKSFVEQNFCSEKSADKWDKSLYNNKLNSHEITAFGGEKLIAFEQSNNSNNYIFVLVPYSSSFSDYLDIGEGFSEYGYNIVYIKNRSIPSYGVKESFDLLKWIDYFNKLDSNINIVLFGESIASNTIFKVLETKIPVNVKCAIVDEIKPYYLGKNINDYCLENEIDNSEKFTDALNKQISELMNLNLEDISVDESLINNSLPICFVQNKIADRYDYYNFLKIYNSNYKNQKVYFTETQKRNYTQDNYFSTLVKFIQSVC